jgi:hypothetical protein
MGSRVYIPSFDEYGEVISLGAFFSKVGYTHLGVMYEVFLLNDQFEIVDEEDELIWEEDN